MKVLSLVHGPEARAELFAPVVEAGGHVLDEWSFAWRTPPPAPLETYDAVLVFGGAMHADQDEAHPWLPQETAWLESLIARGTPLLGVCLGVQLLARAAGAHVGRLGGGPEIGWYEVELTDAGVADPVLGALPRRFESFQWHHYTYAVPTAATELAASERCTQAFRLAEACWGVQFHPEVTTRQIKGWATDLDDPPPDPERLLAETEAKIAGWNSLGRLLCTAFLAAAERLATGV